MSRRGAVAVAVVAAVAGGLVGAGLVLAQVAKGFRDAFG